MVNEELYIIVNGERKKLDLPSPSGITLNFVSNLFNDLSKINSSYSYTFKLPRTANNVRVLELVDDVRADGRFTRIKNEAEFIYNGVPLLKSASLYVSEVTGNDISAVMTWGVNKGLQEITRLDISLNELGNHLSDGDYDYIGDRNSENEKDKVVFVGGDFTRSEDYNPTQPYFKSVHSGGYDWIHSNYGYYVESNSDVLLRNKSMQISVDDEIPTECHINYQGGNTFKYRMTYAYPAPVIPVPFIVNTIAKIYGLNFDFDGDLYNSLCVPLVANKISDAMSRLNYVSLTFDDYVLGAPHGIDGVLVPHGRIVNNYPNINAVSNITYEAHDSSSSILYSGVNDIKVAGIKGVMVVDYGWADMQRCEFKYRIAGNLIIEVQKDTSLVFDDDNAPRIFLRGRTYASDTYADLGELKPVRVDSYFEGGLLYNRLVFNFNPEDGFDYFESEVSYRTGLLMFLAYGKDGDYGFYRRVTSISGSLKVYGIITNYAFDCHINLFKNLPDISCLDFIKSICYALGGYPYQEGNVVKIQKYSNIIEAIKTGDIKDWSGKITHANGTNAENFSFTLADATDLTLAKKNYFLMKNDEVDEYGNEKKNDKREDAYAHGYTCIKVDNDLLDECQTIFTFPFYGGFLWQKDYYYYSHYRQHINGYPLNYAFTGNGQDMWRIAARGVSGTVYRYTCNEAKPMLGVITTPVRLYEYEDVIEDEEQQDGTVIQVSHREKTGEYEDYLNIDIWNCEKNMNQQMLQALLGNSCLVKEDMRLSVVDLATLDIEKPVYLEKYNSYFAIKTIEVGSDGISKVELIRIPPEILYHQMPDNNN